MSQYICKNPVLLITFNRLDTTIETFKEIAKVKPSKIYLASDGARNFEQFKVRKEMEIKEMQNNSVDNGGGGNHIDSTKNPSQTYEINIKEIEKQATTEAQKVKETREYLLSHINWECEIKTRFLDKNLGCKYGVSSAISWFFENEKQGIILEDDCVPNESFFRFCDEMLEKYANCDKINMISGFSALDFAPKIKRKMKEDYYFSKFAHIWGWASWRRAWSEYILEFSIEDFDKIDNFFNKYEKEYWANTAQYLDFVDTWDYQWGLTNWLNNKLSVYPKNNMITNIGCNRPDATHTTHYCSTGNMKSYALNFPLKHPKEIKQNKRLDKINCEIIFCDISEGIERIFRRITKRPKQICNRIKNSIKKRLKKYFKIGK